jgi:hypothetical protein
MGVSGILMGKDRCCSQVDSRLQSTARSHAQAISLSSLWLYNNTLPKSLSLSDYHYDWR